MNKLNVGSICLTELVEAAKSGHSAFVKAQNGKIYCNIKIWQNDTPDKYGNSISLQLNPTKEKRDVDGSPYIGNAKEAEVKPPVQATEHDVAAVIGDGLDGLPF